MEALAHLLRLCIQHLLRHLFPGKAEVALHRDHPQADAPSWRKQDWAGIVIVALRREVSGDGFVGEIAGGEDVGKRAAALLADAKTLGQVNFDEVAVSSAKAAERIEGLDDSGAPGPASSYATGQRHHSDAPLGKGTETGGAIAIGVMGTIHAIRLSILNEAGDGKAVLRQADAAGTKILTDLFVLCSVEAEVIEEGIERSRLISVGIVRSRQHVVKQRVNHARVVGLGAASRGESLQFGTAHG